MTKNNNKGSAKKKLLPAAAMLTTSAVMLSTATYAWFTMSREVEVTGINMTATVPEDLQISLGQLGKDYGNVAAIESDKVSLANSTGFLTYTSGNADNGNVAPPANTWDWSNSADISAYYQFGKLMPASSRDGATIFYTADATGSGRTVNSVAKYFAANSALTPSNTGDSSTDKANATLHAKNAADDAWKNGETGNYQKATGWDKTNDDGYYVDIPVWLRSSATDDINISVAGYVLPGNIADTVNGDTETQLELYKAVRVAILNDDGSVSTTNNVLPLGDAWDTAQGLKEGSTDHWTSIVSTNSPYSTFITKSILDSGIYIERTTESSGLWAVNQLKDYSSEQINADKTGHIQSGDKYGEYTTYNAYNGTDSIATVKAAASGDDYGEKKKLIIRVWLDGEDEQCWNDNAGQDWAISLKFSKIDSTASTP